MNGKQVLIVDDSLMISRRLERLLEGIPGLGDLRYAGSYAETISHLTTDAPDIIVLDINLPDRNGIDLLRYVREHYPAIRVIMFSNQATDSYRRLCRDLGAVAFIDKSTEIEQISILLSSLL